MIEQLRKLLNEAIIDKGNRTSKTMLQYETSDGEIIYLNKERLTIDQINLLNIFLTPVAAATKNESADQIFWKRLLHGDHHIQGGAPITAPFYQLFHFDIIGDLQDVSDFEEAIQSLFTTEITLVWNSLSDGLIVIYIPDEEMVTDDDTIVETIMSDFYVQMTIFKGSVFSNLEDAHSTFTWEQAAFTLAKRVMPNHKVFNKERLIPHLLANEVSVETKKRLLQSITPLQEDKELLKTIKVFFECNLNTTLAAKKLFMHRNSLQYRIDKFIERTGIDIKQFQQAAAMYMLIALNDIKG